MEVTGQTFWFHKGFQQLTAAFFSGGSLLKLLTQLVKANHLASDFCEDTLSDLIGTQ